jgi:hypothetical protein
LEPGLNKIIENARIVYQEKIAGQIFRLRLHSPEIAGAARCGQFAMIRVREGTDPLLRRPFSFSRIYPEDGDAKTRIQDFHRKTFDRIYRINMKTTAQRQNRSRFNPVNPV